MPRHRLALGVTSKAGAASGPGASGLHPGEPMQSMRRGAGPQPKKLCIKTGANRFPLL